MRGGRVLRARVRRRAVVTLKSGATFEGIVTEADGQALVLHQAVAVAMGERSSNVTVDGEAVLLLADVAYLQFP